jgi:uncharacterized protein YndB with AHSA1/START domain
MRDPEKGSTYVCFGEFQEVDPPNKVVYTWSWEPPEMDVGRTLVTVEFHERGDATELVLTHEKFPTAEAASEHSKGWTGCLGVFAGYVESK